ncbi:MAG: FkbM family methyltransferase [Pseudomonadota bacterium]
MDTGLEYETIIETNGVKVPFVETIITSAIAGPMRRNRYEGAESDALRRILKPGDRVLELGAGVGLLSSVAAQNPDVTQVVAVEANPALIPMIKETHKLNNLTQVEVLHGIAAAQDAPDTSFYVREHFWSSSIEPDSRPYDHVANVPVLNVHRLIEKYKPTVLVCDIEGGEYDLFDDIDLSGLRAIIIEFHPRVYGNAHVDKLLKHFGSHGLSAMPVPKPNDVRCLIRYEVDEAEKDWPPANPKFFISTCMKDEGPYILEWVAWHKSIGIDSFVVFTNDCSDGTDLILDRLEELGHVRHLPNPAILSGSSYLQPAALAYTPHLSEWRKSDFFISIDVDEFINVRVGDGTMMDLIQNTEFFDALSMAEINHGSNNRLEFEPGLVTEQFPHHQGERPGPRKALRGVKTITRISSRVEKPRNHRPDFKAEMGMPVWRDGSGDRIDVLANDPSLNGIDVRGRYSLVSLDHFPLKSLDSYLIKMFRGDVVVKDKRVSQRYWRTRNRNEKQSSTFERQQPAFRKALDLLMSDKELSMLHQKACHIHKDRAATLRDTAEFKERREWILANAWDDGAD